MKESKNLNFWQVLIIQFVNGFGAGLPIAIGVVGLAVYFKLTQ